MPVEQLPDPPAPPDAPRRLRLYRYQWVGVAFLLVLPALAVAGVFGESFRTATASGPGARLEVTYPHRFRYKQLNSIEARVRNTSGARVDTLRLVLDSAFASRFSTVRAIPAFERPWEVALTDVAPGETRLVVVEIQGEHYGRHEGSFRLAGTDTVGVPLSVRIFP